MNNNLGNRETMSKNIRRYVEINGISLNRMAQDLGIPATTVSNWVNMNTYPRIDKIELMARYFNITKADLVEEPTEQSLAATRSASLVRAFEQLNERDKAIIEAMVNMMLVSNMPE